jgi:hypothetical protein
MSCCGGSSSDRAFKAQGISVPATIILQRISALSNPESCFKLPKSSERHRHFWIIRLKRPGSGMQRMYGCRIE